MRGISFSSARRACQCCASSIPPRTVARTSQGQGLRPLGSRHKVYKRMAAVAAPVRELPPDDGPVRAAAAAAEDDENTTRTHGGA